VLVSGREYRVLRRMARDLPGLDALVAENGAVVEAPVGARRRVFGRAIAARAARRLRSAGLKGFDAGEVVISLDGSRRAELERSLVGIEVELVENVDRVMVLPRSVTKGSGVHEALRGLGLRGGPFAAIGDAANDLPMLEAARLSGAVANAEPEVRRRAAYLCRRRFSAGVTEFLDGPVRDLVARG